MLHVADSRLATCIRSLNTTLTNTGAPDWPREPVTTDYSVESTYATSGEAKHGAGPTANSAAAVSSASQQGSGRRKKVQLDCCFPSANLAQKLPQLHLPTILR